MTADEKTGDKRDDDIHNGGCDPKGTCKEEASVPLPESIEPQKQVSENPLDSSKEANEDEAEEESMGSTDKEEENDSGQSSPRGVLENNPVVGGSDSDSTTSSSSSTLAVGAVSESTHGTQWRNLICNFLRRKKQSMRRLSTFPPGEVRRKGLMRRFGSMRSSRDVVLEDHVCPSVVVRGKPSWRNFDYKELQDATDNFSSERLIGKGGHAEVYKGSLPDGELVAVKRLMKKDSEEGKISDFLSELGIIAHVNHPNAARLLGFSLHGGLHLVLKFTPHGSLASVLHGSSKEKLEWGTRFKIALGVAEGLLYLHKGCHRRIIHRDIKASNILLTEDYQPQISDFGLAKWLPDQLTHHVVFPIEGTFGYLAPEYFMHGVVSEKTDVFAFGVLLLELVTGRRAVDSCRQSLVMWAKPLLDVKEVPKLVDALLGDSYDSEEMNRSVTVAAMCINHMSTNRPQMKQVVEILKGEDGSVTPTRKEVKLSGGKPPVSDAACEMEDYTCSTYLNDLNRYKQLVLNGE